ncbi:caspase family protein [Streptomyces sp. NPDC059373]
MALLIANYDYQDAGLRRLTAPGHDTEALAAVLRDPDIAGFEVTTLINEPHHRVGEAIGDLYRDRRRDDLTLLYFTGHGLKDDDGRLYLATANTRRDSLLFTSLPAEQIDHAMSGCMSRQKVLILDCCYSGAFPAGRAAKADTTVHALERFQGRGRTVLTASDATQYSFEGNEPHGTGVQSVFTRHLVAGLRDGSADLDGDGDITLDELYSYVHDKVVDEMPQQRPKKQDDVEGRIVIARNINWALPTYLRHALSSPIPTDRMSALDGLAHLHRKGNDLVRRLAADEIRSLVDDDSRTVSLAAAARLQAILPQTPESPPAPAPAPAPEPEPERTLPQSAPMTEPVTQPADAERVVAEVVVAEPQAQPIPPARRRPSPATGTAVPQSPVPPSGQPVSLWPDAPVPSAPPWTSPGKAARPFFIAVGLAVPTLALPIDDGQTWALATPFGVLVAVPVMLSAITCGTVGWLASHGSTVLGRRWLRWWYNLLALITLILVLVGDGQILKQTSGLGVAAITAVVSCGYQIRGAVILWKGRNRKTGTAVQ